MPFLIYISWCIFTDLFNSRYIYLVILMLNSPWYMFMNLCVLECHIFWLVSCHTCSIYFLFLWFTLCCWLNAFNLKSYCLLKQFTRDRSVSTALKLTTKLKFTPHFKNIISFWWIQYTYLTIFAQIWHFYWIIILTFKTRK